jgi:hypothetical protein
MMVLSHLAIDQGGKQRQLVPRRPTISRRCRYGRLRSRPPLFECRQLALLRNGDVQEPRPDFNLEADIGVLA